VAALDEATGGRRSYDSPLRRQRVAETRERILAAGAALLHEVPTWKWQALTVREVARRAEVNERTVYRHFANERELRDAVMARFEHEAGIDLDDLALDDVVPVTRHLLEFVSGFPIEPRTPRDATVAAARQRGRDALLAAVAAEAPDWTAAERERAAGILDVLWGVVSYERLVVDWEMAPAEAVRTVTWVVGLVIDAVREGRPPA
jgi:AcrR family transcriptional regulator